MLREEVIYPYSNQKRVKKRGTGNCIQRVCLERLFFLRRRRGVHSTPPTSRLNSSRVPSGNNLLDVDIIGAVSTESLDDRLSLSDRGSDQVDRWPAVRSPH